VGAGVGEANLGAQVVDRDQPVGQRHVPLRAGTVVPLEQPLSSGGDRLPDAVPGEQRLVERGHELRRRHRVHAVGHRHHRRAPRLEQRGRDRGFQFLADCPGLARVQHHDGNLAVGQRLGDLRRADLVAAAAGLLENQDTLARVGHHSRAWSCDPAAASGTDGHRPVPVEMHHVKRRTRGGGLPQHLTEGGERRRAQHGQLHLAAHRLQPLQQRPRHHLVPHVTCAVRAGNHHQYPQLASGHLQHLCCVGHRQAPGDPARPERDRPGLVAHQLPRQPEQPRLGRPEDHFNAPVPRPLEAVPRWAGTKNRPENLLPPRRQPPGYRRAAFLPHPERCQQVVLQVPAQVLQRLGVQRPRKLGPRYLLRQPDRRHPQDISPAVRAQVHISRSGTTSPPSQPT
jgi:hypothetical protein